MKTTLTSENPAAIKIINRTDADLIIQNIKKELQTWKLKNFLYHLLVGVLGTVAILGSVIVSVYLDTRSEILTAERLKLIAIASTVSLSILSAFNIISKTNNYIAACDLMQVALFKHNARLINLGTLIEVYDKANKIIGGINFNFDKNFTGAPGKTVVSVDTAEEMPVVENERIPADETDSDLEAKELEAKENIPAKSKNQSNLFKTNAGKSTPPAAGSQANLPITSAEPAPVKSEAIINTDEVSVMVSEK
ncbi:hypothetical protein [Adhaeribacter rhizoryzae]|uniref:SLATT domain-containing protein n=1 Tax=Adhaeribacter rhizoryzae TaxID=2607907 RepID=A0A5M6DMQ8_9BACT|nr:hypothetical protein [Adhaeribacter rhizoryzae]KAA5548827.1 hypothetical protein F0145_04765 [Adhaeribacter rhizoryzae]